MRLRDIFFLRQADARPLASFAGCFLLGLILCARMPVPVAICAPLLVALILAMFALRGRRRTMAALLLLTGLAAGMTRMSVAQSSVVTVETQYSVQMEGRVISEPYVNENTGRRIMKYAIDAIDGAPARLRLRLYLRGEDEALLDEIAYGQRLRLTGHIWAPDPVTNPYEFDFGAYLARQGLLGYATAKIDDVEILSTARDWNSAIIGARHEIGKRIDLLFPKNRGMMRALILGDRTMLDDELRASFNRTGIAHLISISGMHVTTLAALLAFLFSRFMPRRYAYLLSILFLLPYGALIGFTTPFVRALLMFALMCGARVAGRPNDGITGLSAALLCLLALRPMSIFDAGFVLSFSASAGIILLVPPLSGLTGLTALQNRRQGPDPRRLNRMLRRLALYVPRLLCASAAAQLAALPGIIHFFGVQSLVSLPFNLVCIPLCMLGFISGLFVLVLSIAFTPLAVLLAAVPEAMFGALNGIVGYGASIPAAIVRIGRYTLLLTLAHWAVVLGASDLSRISPGIRRFMPLSLIVIAGLSSLLIFLQSLAFSVVFLDAGQADCAVIRSRGHTYMMDVGDTYTPAADYLDATCLHLDGVILSHPHQDHAGGLSRILESFTPDVILVPKGWFQAEDVDPAVTEGIDAARARGVEIRELSRGDRVALSDEAALTVYSPAAGALPDEINDLSLLALVECEDTSVLFTGDLSRDGEPDFVPDADVLKVSHHGSNKATSDRFVADCSPGIAIVSVGENNYGHPSPETLERLTEAGASVYTTLDCGAITLRRRRGEWRIDTFLEAGNELE